MDIKEMKTFTDFLRSLYSRKLMVFVIATILLLVEKITQDIWLTVAITYMGAALAGTLIDSIKAKSVASKTSSLTEVVPPETDPEKEGSA